MKSINQFYRFSFSLFLCLQFKINAQNISTELSLSPIFSNHMVFQQKNVNPIWGKANPGANVVVEASWGESSKSKTDKNGNWMAKLKTRGNFITFSHNSIQKNFLTITLLIGD